MKSLICALLLLSSSVAFTQTVSTVAGIAGVIGNNNGPGTSASFNNPHGIATDRAGNIFVANRFGHTIRKISPAGIVSTFAGTGSQGATDGNGTAAYFNEPWAVACDTLGNIYVADTKNYKIRKINAAGDVTTLAGTGVFGVTNGAANIAQFGFPSGITVNGDGSIIYVCDRMTNTIRKIENGMVTTAAGVVFSPGNSDGPASTAKFDHPYSIALDDAGNLIIADEFNHKIRKLSTNGMVSTIAGNGSQGSTNGPALSSSFNSPWGVCVDENGDILVGDANNFTIRKISQGTVSVFAGQNGIAGMMNGPLLQSTFNGVSSLAYSSTNNSYYLCDPYSQLVRKISPLTITLATSTGSTTFCNGSTITLVASPNNLSNYVFREGATIIGSSQNGTLTISTLNIGLLTISCTATGPQGQTIQSNDLILDITAGLQVSINVTGSTTLCPGDTAVLSSSVQGTYLWSTGATTASINATAAGTYTVTVINAQGCIGTSAAVNVSELQAPAATVSVGTALPVCVGDSTYLTAATANSYSWSTGDTTQTIYITSPGSYTVIVSNGAGCSAMSQPMNINFYPQSTSVINPSGTVLIPPGGSTNLTAGTGSSYQWSNGLATQTILVNTAGTYTVTVTDLNGCESVPASVQVSFISQSNMIAVTGSTAFCEGDSVQLTSAFADNNQWYINGQLITGAIQQVYFANQPGFYQVGYTSSPSPTIYSDSVEIIVHTVPNAVTAIGDSVCKNQSATLNIAAQPGIAYQWYSTSSGGTPLGTGLSFSTPPIQQTTDYYVELSNSYGCVRENRFAVTATAIPQPDAQFTALDPTLVTGGFEVIFLSNYVAGYSYFWDFGDPASNDNNSSDHNSSHLYALPGEFTISLTVTNSFGCVESYTKVITVSLADNLFIPTGFTPNGDGNNDLFRVRGNNISHYDMSIFNQWGQRIWSSKKETTGWNGQANGEYVANGNYAYAIEVHFENGSKTFHRGNISVIR